MTFVESMKALETAFNYGTVNIDAEKFDQGFESWVNSLSYTELAFQFSVHA